MAPVGPNRANAGPAGVRLRGRAPRTDAGFAGLTPGWKEHPSDAAAASKSDRGSVCPGPLQRPFPKYYFIVCWIESECASDEASEGNARRRFI